MEISVAELAKFVGGSVLSGDDAVVIRGFASLRQARPGELSFFTGAKHGEALAEVQATAVLVPRTLETFPDGVCCIGVDDPSKSFEKVTDTYGLQPLPFRAGVHPSAVVAETSKLDPSTVAIGANAVIEDGVELAPGVEIGAGCYVGRDVRIGKDSKLFANVTVHEACLLGERVILHSSAVIGADGFGYEFEEGRHRKVRQSGSVQIDNDVEIGAGTMVDRGRFGRTRIGEGTKIDNLVQIGHNCIIGKHVIIVACCALAGSCEIGDYVVIAAQVGVGGHVKVGAQSVLAGRCGVTKDVPPGQTYMGYPSVPISEEKRRIAGTRRIPQLQKRIRDLEERFKAIEK